MELIKDFMVTILYMVLIGTIYGVRKFFVNSIGEEPNRRQEIKVEDLKSQKAYELQVDSYFRNISSGDISKLFRTWYDFAFNITSINQLKDGAIDKMFDDIIAYGSSETIRRLAVLQSFTFENQNKADRDEYVEEFYDEHDKTKGNSKDVFRIIYFLCYVIVSLKVDFTGNKIDATDLIKIKKNDYKEFEKSYKKANKEVRELLNLNKEQ